MTALLTKIKRWLRPRLPEGSQYSDETSEGKLFENMMKACPECHKPPDWMRGPEGGMCVNVFCGHCGQGYNIAPALQIADKIHRDQKYIMEK